MEGARRTEIENTWLFESISGFSTSPSLLYSIPEITRWSEPPTKPIYSFKELFFILTGILKILFVCVNDFQQLQHLVYILNQSVF